MNEEKYNSKTDVSHRGKTGKTFFRNPDTLKRVIIGLTGFVMLVLVFGAGVTVGTLKARYSYRWAESYHKNFAGPRGGFLDDWRRFPAGDFLSGHGSFGEIIEINPAANSEQTRFVIKGRENAETVVITNQNTTVTRGRETIKDGLKVGDRVVVIGSPSAAGQIEAKLIRVFDERSKKLPLRRSRPTPFL